MKRERLVVHPHWITSKLHIKSLPFQSIQHSITAQDHQPTPDSCVMSMVMGQLKADTDQVMGFQQTFLLKNVDNKWICTNDMFRLALHNFGA
nr:nuclear transport factor 2 isoform X3 [Salvelinus alpinus]